MKDIINSVSKTIEGRLSNSLYGTFFISWIIFHWNFIFSLLFLGEEKIWFAQTLLKNEYLIQRFFNPTDWYFYFSWIAPFIITYLIVWKLPKWILIPAFKKDEEYRTEKRKIKITEERKVESEQTQLEKETVKKFQAVSEQVSEKKKIQETDPTILWREEFNMFKQNFLYKKFDYIIQSIYERNGDITQTKQDSYSDHEYTVFNIPRDILAYSHTNDLVIFTTQRTKIELTDKGKFFAKEYLSAQNIQNPA